jgi:hypothetical protein
LKQGVLLGRRLVRMDDINQNDPGWVAPPPQNNDNNNNNVDMDLEDDEGEEEEEEEGEDDSDEDEGEDDDGVPLLPDVLGLTGYNVFDGGIADDDTEEDNGTTNAAAAGKPREKATEADIVR